jgi:hypothetical protein
MTGGSNLSVDTGAGERRWAGGAVLGRLGQAAVLGCDGEKVERAAARRTRPERKRGGCGLD